MELSTKEVIKKKLLDAQEMVRDYEMYAKRVQDMRWPIYSGNLQKSLDIRREIAKAGK